MKTNYPGINYAGIGSMVNRNKEISIRFGVINQRHLIQAWSDCSEPNYGKPSCPKCGNHAQECRRNFDYSCECGVFACGDCSKVFYPMELGENQACPDCGNETEKRNFESARFECEEYHCVECGFVFGSESAFGDPVGFYVDDGKTKAECGENGDIFVCESPYFTYAQFCSPCAPGACYLTNYLDNPDENNKAYCFGLDWFEDETAPYPIYEVKTGKLIYSPKQD